jgi:hypothetical protein
MGRLTTFSRFLITLLIVGGIFFLVRNYLPQLKERFGSKTTETETTVPADNPSSGEAQTSQSSGNNASSNSQPAATTTRATSTFSYKPTPPLNGKLKGVVELGATGFNSFILTIDAQKDWKLEKAEYGNSLVLENMASDADVTSGLKRYIGGMLDYGVSPREIHFVVSSGALKAESTQKIIKALKTLNYVVNTVTPEQEGTLALKCVLPKEFDNSAFVTDIGSGNTKISWKEGGKVVAVETHGSKYFQNNVSDDAVYNDVKAKAARIPSGRRKTCFIIGGVPFELAKQVRNGKERYTVLNTPQSYNVKEAKSKAGINIYRALADETGCNQFVFDWDANFTIGFLLGLN